MTTAHEPLLIDGPADAPLTWILAHGAGAGMDTPFMNFFARGVAAAGFRVVRFEFPYMRERRATGGRRPPNSAAILRETWCHIIDQVRQHPGPTPYLAIGGKSMGGRMASAVADEMSVDALVCLGFPFQAPGKSQPERLQLLQHLTTPTLILQGTRDPFGSREQVAGFSLPAAVEMLWLDDGNHDFVPRKASGHTTAQNWQAGIAAIGKFFAERSRAPRRK